jgi:hypothetical protein
VECHWPGKEKSKSFMKKFCYAIVHAVDTVGGKDQGQGRHSKKTCKEVSIKTQHVRDATQIA